MGNEEHTIFPFLTARLWKLRVTSDPGEEEILKLKALSKTEDKTDQLKIRLMSGLPEILSKAKGKLTLQV